jgi:hypothetical protein
MPIDFDSYFRNRIEGLLICASWVQALRALLGLEGVSQIWNGNPAWYLSLKCYPCPDHPCLAGFSPEERRLVQSDRFDTTHTPHFEAADGIPETLFTVGSLELLCGADDTAALLTFQSLDTLRIVQSDAATPEPPEASRLVRNVAGWALGFPLFDCLVGLYTHFTRQPPAFMGATRCRGFEYVVGADGHAACRSSRQSTQTALTIGFQASATDHDWLESLWRSRLETGEKVQTVQRLPATFHRAVGRDLPDDIRVNPLWWEIAGSDFKSELASSCGCGEAHCRHVGLTGPHEH